MRIKRTILFPLLAFTLAGVLPVWASVSFVASVSNQGSSGTALSVTHGLSLVNGDFLIAIVHTNNVSDSISDNNGAASFTDVFGEDGQSGSHSYRIFTRTVDGTEGATFDFSSNGNSRWSISILQWRGSTNLEFDVTPSATTSNNGGSDTTPIGNDITVAANTVGIFVFFVDHTGRGYSGITDSYVERLLENNNPTQDTGSYSKAYGSSQATTTIEITCDTSVMWDTQHFSIQESGAVAAARRKVVVY